MGLRGRREEVGLYGALVRQHRQRLGMTQEELAERSGLSIRGLRKIESGQVAAPRAATVRLLADVFALVGAERDQFTTAAARVPAGSGGEPLPPAQLPMATPGFVGRTAHLARLDHPLGDLGGPAVIHGEKPPESGGFSPWIMGTRSARVVILAGAPGVGKTALALYWAHRARAAFPDGQLYRDLRGFDPSGTAVAAGEVLGGFLTALGVPGTALPAGLDAQAALYRTLLAGRRMLIVLDNARDAAQVRPLLPGAPGCLVLVTSRAQLRGLVSAEGAEPLAVGLMSPAEAYELLAARLGADRLAAEPDAAREVVERCARLPLALAITAARAAVRPDVPLAALAAELRGSLDALADADAASDARTVFSWSYRALSPDAARLFRLLGLHPGPDIGVAAAASLAGVPEVRDPLAELARAHLVDEPVPGRYRWHDLLRAYAGELAVAAAPAAELRAARERLLAHYLALAHRGALAANPNRAPITLPDRPHGTVVPENADPVGWFGAEHASLLALTRLALAEGFADYAWRLAWATTDFHQRGGHWADWVASQRIAVAATRSLGDAVQEARAHRYLGRAYTLMGEPARAGEAYREALELSARLHDLPGQAHGHMSLANLRQVQGDHRAALEHAQRALDLFTAAGDRVGVGHTLNMTGWFLMRLGDYPRALARCTDALARLEELSDPPGQANTWDSLGCIHYGLGETRRAVACFRQSARIFGAGGDHYARAEELTRLGEAQSAAGYVVAAHKSWERARAVLAGLGDPDPARTMEKYGLAQFSAARPGGAP